MTQSPEYPDLKWVPPKSWTNANRSSVQLVVIHDTEGSSHSESAEDGAAYDARRTDGTSTHYFHDNTSTVQCVRTEDQAHTARTQGNRRGIHHELCAKASFSRARWLDPDYGLPMLRRAARQAARDAKKWDIPVRKLSASQVADGVKGFCGHADVTKAFPQDNGTHTDPGPNFPWDEFLDMVRDELEDDVTKSEFTAWMTEWAKSAAGREALATAVLAYDPGKAADGKLKAGGIENYGSTADENPTLSPAWALGRAPVAADLGYQIRSRVDQLAAALKDLTGRDFTDEQAIVAGVLAGLDPAAIAAAIPQDLAEHVADELAARLAG